MTERVVTSQAELDQAIADKVGLIKVDSPAGVWLKISDLGSSRAELRGSSRAELRGSSRAELRGSSSAELRESSSAVLRESSRAELWESSRAVLWESSSAVLWESSSAELWESSRAVLRESSSAVLWESSRAELWESSRAELRESSRAELRGSSSAVLRESSRAVLRESSRAELWESSRAELWESSRAELRGSSNAVLRESSRAELWESSRAVLRESSSAVLRESSSAHAHAKSKVTAAPLCAVFLHDSTVDVSGGVILDHSNVKDMDGRAWCDYYGVNVSRGIATVYKAVNDQWTTSRGVDYSPGAKPSCDDFRDTDTCGGGLHFGPTPRHARTYFDSATKYVAAGIKVSELRPITGDTAKCKAPRVVRPCVEVDIDGKQVEVTP